MNSISNATKDYFNSLKQMHTESVGWHIGLAEGDRAFCTNYTIAACNDPQAGWISSYSAWSDERRLSIDAALFAALRSDHSVLIVTVCSVLLHSLVEDRGELTCEFSDLATLMLARSSLSLPIEYRLCLVRYAYCTLLRSQSADYATITMLLAAVHASLCDSYLQETFAGDTDEHSHNLWSIYHGSRFQRQELDRIMDNNVTIADAIHNVSRSLRRVFLSS